MKKLIILGAVGLLMSDTATAQETTPLKPLNIITMTGSYAGTFLCSSGEMGMSLSINDIGPSINADGKSIRVSKRLIRR